MARTLTVLTAQDMDAVVAWSRGSGVLDVLVILSEVQRHVCAVRYNDPCAHEIALSRGRGSSCASEPPWAMNRATLASEIR